MTLKILTILATLSTAGAAFAQDRPPPSPEMQAARQAVMKACAADMKTLCDGKAGREAMMCMRENADKVSQPCKDALAAMPRRGPPPAQ